MLTQNGQSTIQGKAPIRRGVAWRRIAMLSALFFLMSLCHGSVLAAVAGAAMPADQSLATAARDGVPAHLVDCAVDSEAAAPSTASAGIAWGGSLLGEPAWLLGLDQPVAEPPDTAPFCTPGVRRALLQIFLI